MLKEKESNTVLSHDNSSSDVTGKGIVIRHNSNTGKADVQSHELSAVQEMSNTPHSLAVPFFTRKRNAEQPAKNGHVKTEPNHSSATAEKTTEVRAAGKLADTKVEHIGEITTSNPFAKPSSNQEASKPSNPFAKPSSDQAASKPSNPFAKSSSNQSASKSFFDSIKKSTTNGS